MAIDSLANGSRSPSQNGAKDPLESSPLLPQRSYSPTSHTQRGVKRRQFTVQELQSLQPGSSDRQAQQQRVQQPRYESLDYEEVENIVYRSDKATTGALDGLAVASSKWLVCFLIGVITATAAFLVNLAVENIAGFKFYATLTLLSRGHWIGSYLAYVAMNGTLVLLAVVITLFVGPAAAGSGIPDVKAYLNGIDVPGIFYLSTLVAKLTGSIAAVAGGLAIGKEGPFVHAGACVAALVSQGGTPACQTRASHHLWNDRDRADMVTVGTAAGVAAAFRSPVGGVLFALEEMSSWWRNQLMWLIFFTTAVVSVTIRVLMKMCSGEHCGFFGSGGFIYFEIEAGQEAYEVYELLPMLLLGVVGGLLGSSFIVCNASLSRWRRRVLAQYGVRGRVVEGIAISVLTSTVSFLLPLMFQCQRCPASAGAACPRKVDAHMGNFVSFGCTRNNTYNDLATLFFNTQDDAIRALFSSSTKREYTVPALILFVTAFYWLAVLTYGMSCPTGFFVPAILCGAAYGRLVGIFVADRYPHQHIDEGTYALLGAASFLGGSMRLTMCTCVMLLELTDNMALLPLIMLVLLVAKGVGDGTGVKPIYEVQMQYKGLPFLDPAPDPLMRHITAKESCGKPPVTFNRVERVSHIVQVLKSCNHNGFPVYQTNSVDGDRSLAGVVLRQHVLLLLTTRNAFQTAPYVTETASRIATTFSVADFCKPMSAPGLSVNDVNLSPEELCQYLDLGPYLNPSYYVVQDDASLSKVYTLFRTLGIRHLCVIPKAHEVVGVITREDLHLDTLDKRLQTHGGQYGMDGTLAGFGSPGTLGGHGARANNNRRTGGGGASGPDSTRSPPTAAGTSDRTTAHAAATSLLADRGRDPASQWRPPPPRGAMQLAERGQRGTGGGAGVGTSALNLGSPRLSVKSHIPLGTSGPSSSGGSAIRFTEQHGIDILPQLSAQQRPQEPVGRRERTRRSHPSGTSQAQLNTSGGGSGSAASSAGGAGLTQDPSVTLPFNPHKQKDGLQSQQSISLLARGSVPDELLVDSPSEASMARASAHMMNRRSGGQRGGSGAGQQATGGLG